MPSTTLPAAATGLPSRRTALTALASLGAAMALPKGVKAASLPDRIPALYAESCRVSDVVNGGYYATEDEADAHMAAWGACEAQAIANPATTPAGAIASIEWARTELLTFGFDASDPDKGARFVMALLDGAIASLRLQGGVS